MSGVCIVLMPDTPIPYRLRALHNTEAGSVLFEGKPVPTVAISGGQAAFITGGSVSIRLPGEIGYRQAFPALTVIEIRNLSTGDIKRSPRFCESCIDFTGVEEGRNSSEKEPAFDEVWMRCKLCGEDWVFPRYRYPKP